MVGFERSSGLSALAKYGLVDLETALANLDQLVSIVGDNARPILAQVGLAQNPDQSLSSVLRLAESHPAQIKTLLKREEYAKRLCLVLGASSALTDFIERVPESLSIIMESSIEIPSREEMAGAIGQAVLSGETAPDKWALLRRSYRQQLLRIALFDLTASDPTNVVTEVAAALADLAGAAIEAGLTIARWELIATSEFGTFSAAEVDATDLAVIAMGKCGARELNYISDVDVIFVGESNNQDVIDNQRALEIGTKLATRMMRSMDATAAEPALWQVDPNLRPEGKSGALVRTLESHVAYYERWAESWEFQALLKARPLAGSIELGQRYVAALWPKVWQSATREGFVESAQKMRERVTDYIPEQEVDREIKLGPGGLRDVEFTVQLLQLVHGRTDESIRIRDTISAIQKLSQAGYIGRNEAALFESHYRYLRVLEHRIQLSAMRRTHLMPTDEVSQRALARVFGTRSTAEELLANWSRVKSEVRALHQKIFYRPLLSAVSKLDPDSLQLSTDQIEDRLHAIGFIDPKSALSHINALTSGLSRRATIQRQLLPVLLQWFAEGTDPDAALVSFRRLSEDLGDSHWYLRMLRDSSGAAERMTHVLGNSRMATSLFERIPEAAAWFDDVELLRPLAYDQISEEISAIIDRHDGSDAAAAAIRSIRRREVLRLAIGAVLDVLKLEDVQAGLTSVYDCYLVGMLGLAQLRNKTNTSIEFSIVAMGRYGGRELGFGSDADVMFVHRKLSGDDDLVQKVAERLVADLRQLVKDPILEFELDLELRPEGNKGPITRSIGSYSSYYERWSDTWEAQALLRARVIGGDHALQHDFISLIEQYRYPKDVSDLAIIEIRRIKARMESERLPQGADPKRHMKLGRGSLSDVEWVVQLLQLRNGAEHTELRTPQTIPALSAAVTAGLIAEHDARVLSEAWTFVSRCRSASVLWDGKRTDVLPTDRRQLEGMARIMGYPRGSATALQEDYLAMTRRARSVFERVFFE